MKKAIRNKLGMKLLPGLRSDEVLMLKMSARRFRGISFLPINSISIDIKLNYYTV